MSDVFTAAFLKGKAIKSGIMVYGREVDTSMRVSGGP